MKYKNPLRLAAFCATGILLIGALTQSVYCFYNPSTGRWLSRDPAEERPGPNLYASARNDLVRGVDVLGLCGPHCEIIRPLQVRLTPPRDIMLGGVFAGPADDPIWDGEWSFIWFTMKATFANDCCKFRQQAFQVVYIGGKQSVKKPIHDDTDYENVKYERNENGQIEFSDYDTPGWVPGIVNPENKYFDGFIGLYGYVIDVCNGDKLVGSKRFYSLTGRGTAPNMRVYTYGFDNNRDYEKRYPTN